MDVTKITLGKLVIYNGCKCRVEGVSSPRPLKDKRYADKYLVELYNDGGLLTVPLDDITLDEVDEVIKSCNNCARQEGRGQFSKCNLRYYYCSTERSCGTCDKYQSWVQKEPSIFMKLINKLFF